MHERISVNNIMCHIFGLQLQNMENRSQIETRRFSLSFPQKLEKTLKFWQKQHTGHCIGSLSHYSKHCTEIAEKNTEHLLRISAQI